MTRFVVAVINRSKHFVFGLAALALAAACSGPSNAEEAQRNVDAAVGIIDPIFEAADVEIQRSESRVEREERSLGGAQVVQKASVSRRGEVLGDLGSVAAGFTDAATEARLDLEAVSCSETRRRAWFVSQEGHILSLVLTDRTMDGEVIAEGWMNVPPVGKSLAEWGSVPAMGLGEQIDCWLE